MIMHTIRSDKPLSSKIYVRGRYVHRDEEDMMTT